MPVVIELTLATRPGHYDQALASYLDFVNALEGAVQELSLVIIAGEPSQGVIHGVGIYEDASVAENLVSLPFFADMVSTLEPHLAEPPQRTESALVAVLASETDLRMPEPGVASLVEIAFNAKLGHADQVLALHEDYAREFQTSAPDASLILETSQPGTGRFRVFVMYEHGAIGTAEGESSYVRSIWDDLEPLLADAPRRTELHIVHAFARG